jgi:hypothetical protein
MGKTKIKDQAIFSVCLFRIKSSIGFFWCVCVYLDMGEIGYQQQQNPSMSENIKI